MKFNTWPGVTQKYSGTLAGISAEALLAVTTAVESMVTQRASVRSQPHLSCLTSERCRELCGVCLSCSDLSDDRATKLRARLFIPI
jgi:hypothetical protein